MCRITLTRSNPGNLFILCLCLGHLAVQGGEGSGLVGVSGQLGLDRPEVGVGELGGVLGEHGLPACGSLLVQDEAYAEHGGRLQDGDSLCGLALVEGTSLLSYLTHDVGAAGLVSQEGGKVEGLGGVLGRVEVHVSTLLVRLLVIDEPQGPVTGCSEFTS